MRKKRWHGDWWVGGIAALFVFGFVGGVGLSMRAFRSDTHALWDRINIGDTEASVSEVLGKPIREYSKASAPENYYYGGYGHRERAITGKVLIFQGADMVLYVWFDEHGRVEDMFRGGS